MNPEEPSSPHFERVAICGVGLLGASLGMALRQRGMADHVVGVGRDAGRLAKAAEMGAVDSCTTHFEEGCSQADLIVLCSPISVILEQLPVAIGAAKEYALITDVGSTKRSIVQRATRAARPRVYFVGSHPMAGSEKSGAIHARADLYEGATVILTPDVATNDGALETVRSLWQALGARVIELLPARHDRLVAQLSHLPHLMAAMLAALSDSGTNASPDLVRAVAGPGFRDTTRIAMGSVPMWLDIFLDNRAAALESVDQATAMLADLRAIIAGGYRDALADFLQRAAKLRKELEKGE